MNSNDVFFSFPEWWLSLMLCNMHSKSILFYTNTLYPRILTGCGKDYIIGGHMYSRLLTDILLETHLNPCLLTGPCKDWSVIIVAHMYPRIFIGTSKDYIIAAHFNRRLLKSPCKDGIIVAHLYHRLWRSIVKWKFQKSNNFYWRWNLRFTVYSSI